MSPRSLAMLRKYARARHGSADGHAARGDDPQRPVQGISIQATVAQFRRPKRKGGRSESHGTTDLRWELGSRNL